ncbi:MAG: sulfatase [Pseudozobellia sp.]|nr:sulfatase [Pseudozobellia sp.]MBG48118.1 sulfatase [Pseudozobellia sp.]MBG48746.1 sulfatase [Pseudozobellia sp.]|tara:strand:+ start:1294 stop:2913 length:1620 start_codon:yes stop_codon:yes gene_type:complete
MRSFFLSIVVLLGACSNHKNQEEDNGKNRPNIVWIVAEDQSPEWFPMYGNTTIDLPHLQSLAEDGVVFDNAVAPVPVCAPARSSLITGMYPTTLGTHNMRTHTPWREVNEPLLDSLPSYSPVVPEGVRMFTEYLRKEGYYTCNGPKEDYNFEKTDAAWDESSKDRHYQKRNKDQPFFAVFNYSVCHESQIWSRGKDSLFVKPSEVSVPPYFPDNDTIRHDLAVNYSNLKRLDDQLGKVLDDLKEDGLYENSIIFFYADHGGPFPRHKRALYDTGVKVPLVVKFPENEYAGTRDERLISFIDYAPTVLSLAGIEPPKVMQGTAQFGAFEAERKPEYTYHTSDRFDERYDRLRAVRSPDYKYIKSFNTNISHAMPLSYREQMPMMRELRRLNAKGELNEQQSFWLSATKPAEELYDLNEDPFELNNLAEDPDYQQVLTTYRQLLMDWMEDTNDLGRVDELSLMERWLVKGEQPRLDPLQLEVTDLGIELIEPKSDATIVYKQPQDSVWMVYSNPLPAEMSFTAKAERIGYTDSELLKYEGD